jgi:hypothetical protein
MCHENERGPGVAVQFEHDLDHFLARFGVEIAGWFVGEKDFRLVDKGTGQSDPLLFAAGKLRRVVVTPFSQADPLQQIERERPCAAIAAQLQRHGHVFQRGQRRNELEVLKNKSDVFVANAGASSSRSMRVRSR